MQIDADAVDAVDRGVMQFAVVDGGVVFVPLLGFVDAVGGHEDRTFDPSPILPIDRRGVDRSAGRAGPDASQHAAAASIEI